MPTSERAAGAPRAPRTVSMRDLLAAGVAASAVSTPPRRVAAPVPREGSGGTPKRG